MTAASDTLRDAELMAKVGLQKSSFYAKKTRGEFRWLELKPQLSGATLYSRALVDHWLAGQVKAPEPSRFFPRATPRTTPRRPPGRPRKGQHPMNEPSHGTPQPAGERIDGNPAVRLGADVGGSHG